MLLCKILTWLINRNYIWVEDSDYILIYDKRLPKQKEYALINMPKILGIKINYVRKLTIYGFYRTLKRLKIYERKNHTR